MATKQKAILTFTDNPDGTLGISCVFDPEISDGTISTAASCAIACMEHVTSGLGAKEVEDE